MAVTGSIGRFAIMVGRFTSSVEEVNLVHDSVMIALVLVPDSLGIPPILGRNLSERHPRALLRLS